MDATPIPDTPAALLAACGPPLDAELLEGPMICWRCGARATVVMHRSAWQALPIGPAVDSEMTCEGCSEAEEEA